MITVLPESEGNVLVVKSVGKLTDDDYTKILIPRFGAILKEHGKARCLFEMEDRFHGLEPAALWYDLRFGTAHMHDFDKLGVIGGPKWVEWAMKVESKLFDVEMRTFTYAERDEALAWIKA